MNNSDWQARTRLLLGDAKLERLRNSHILVAGLGGVGGCAVEQLCRAGIGNITLVDSDVVQETNRNRQIIALCSTEGQKKTALIAGRLQDINPSVKLNIIDNFLNENNIPQILDTPFDYVLDAIDTLSPKVFLLAESVKRGLPVVSSMGSGGKTDPSHVRVSEIEKSHSCKLAYKVRKALHRQNIFTGIKVVFSPETVDKSGVITTDGSGNKRSVTGTISYMPVVFGCFCSAVIIRDLLGLAE